jgi:6-phosphogluconolactonase
MEEKMSKREVIIKNDLEDLSNYAVFLIQKIINNSPHQDKNIAFSGGNTPILMFEKLAKLTAINWNHVNIFIVDERYVNTTHEDSNFYQLNKHLLSKIEIPNDNIHHIKYLDNIQKSITDYKQQIKETFNLKQGEIPKFDLIHLGIGEDGHTASLFNNQKKDNKQLIIKTENIKYKRITFNYNILNNAENILFLAAGKRKQQVIKEIMTNSKQYPAGLIDNEGTQFFLLDKKAAGQI